VSRRLLFEPLEPRLLLSADSQLLLTLEPATTPLPDGSGDPPAIVTAGALPGQPAPPTPLPAGAPPSGFTETRLVAGITAPTAMAFAPDGRLFVAQQDGQLRVIKDGALLTTPFVSLTVDASGERGLLGVAFDPEFEVNRFVYLYYTVPGTTLPVTPAHNRVSRFVADGDVAVAGSETVILELDALSDNANHNGGALHVGPDGKLYVAVGDNREPGNAQTLDNRLGKMLRINADGTIPEDNPFVDQATGANGAIWALGLRNPFTFAFQPGTGRLFINDVGEQTFEEVNQGLAGANYGWPLSEGPSNPLNPAFQDPIYSYGRDVGTAIIGGAFYNPTTITFPEPYVGDYFFGDLFFGKIFHFDPANPPAPGQAPVFATFSGALIGVEVGEDGNLYRLMHNGEVWKVEYTASKAPTIGQQPDDFIATVGDPATFTVAASGEAPLAYQWFRGGVEIAGATAPSFTLAVTELGDTGAVFTCLVSNAFGSATSNPAILTVTTNHAPTATITQPVGGTFYVAGETITYAGLGTDLEDGDLSAGAFTWRVDFHHDDHTHPFVPATSGEAGGSFTIATSNEVSANVFYRIHLTVRDSEARPGSTFVDILPRTATLTLAGAPAGVQVTLDGQPVTTPHAVLGVVGMTRTLGVLSPQIVGGDRYTFAGWSDGGAGTHVITTPDTDTTFTATFQVEPFLGVAGFQPTATGFGVAFTREVDGADLNLYDAAAAGLGAPDVTLVGPAGPVRGSLLVDPSTITFIQTGGPLEPGPYTVTLRSAANGFKDLLGGLLDGNGDGTPGDDFVTTFTVATPARVLSVPDFARGPGQPVDVPATALSLPVRLNDGSGLEALDFTLVYDPALLTLSDVALGPTLPASTLLEANLSVPGRARIALALLDPLGAGPVELLRLTAGVPDTAPYRAKGILDLAEVNANEGDLALAADDGLHVAAYFGDGTGNGTISSLDAQRTLRVAVGADSGLAAFPLLDPVVLLDITGNGSVGSLDASRILQEVVGFDRPEIPPLPGTLPLVFGPDPFVSMSTTASASPGGTVTVPVTIDEALGLEAVDLRIGYDPTLLEVVAVRPGAVTAGATMVRGPVTPGSLVVGLVLGSARTAAGGGSLLEVDYRVKPTAAAGVAALDLQQVSLNEGYLVLTPLPVPGPDPTDGAITVVATVTLPATMQEVTARLPVASPRALPDHPRPGEGKTPAIIDWSAPVQTVAPAPVALQVPRSARSDTVWTRRFLLEVALAPSDDANQALRVGLVGVPEVQAPLGPPLA
jgi:glucose/arabinose dehydrogenase